MDKEVVKKIVQDHLQLLILEQMVAKELKKLDQTMYQLRS